MRAWPAEGVGIKKTSGLVDRAATRRARILDAASELFASAGFHATGIAQISKASGVLVGQIYRDFENKEALVAAIVSRDLDALLDEAALCSAADQCSVRAWIAHFICGSNKRNWPLVAEIMAESVRNDRIAAIFRDVDARVRKSLVDGLSLVVPEAPASALILLAETIMTIALGILQRRLTQVELTDDVAAELLHYVERELDRLKDESKAETMQDSSLDPLLGVSDRTDPAAHG